MTRRSVQRNGHSKCYYCRRAFGPAPYMQPTTDHFYPKSRPIPEGRKQFHFIACRACNELKGQMTPEQWYSVMRAVPQWWKMINTTKARGIALYGQLITNGTLPGVGS